MNIPEDLDLLQTLNELMASPQVISVAYLHGLDLGLDKVEDESLVGLDVVVHAAQLAGGSLVL